MSFSEGIRPLEEVIAAAVRTVKPDVKRYTDGMPAEDRMELAKRIYLESTTITHNDIPHGVVAVSEGIDRACVVLLGLVKQPEVATKPKSPENVELDNRLRLLALKSAGGDTPLARVVLKHVAEGMANEGDKFKIYQDNGRDFPQFAYTWMDDLSLQFGQGSVEEAKSTHAELFSILEETTKVASVYPAPRNLDPEAFAQIVGSVRSLKESIGVGPAHAIVSAMSAKKFSDYRGKVYALRGIPYRKINGWGSEQMNG